MKYALLCLLTLILVTNNSTAQEKDSKLAVTYSSHELSLEFATRAAWGALKDCRERGFAVAVAVVDRGGIVQVLLRDRSAGPHTPETAIRKAWSANTFRQSTAALAGLLKNGEMPHQAGNIPSILLIPGALKIEGSGYHLGAIGVSGGSSDIDNECALTGKDAIQEDLDFADFK